MKSMIRRGAIVVALVLSLFAAAGGWAQTGTTSLRGTVLDKSGAVVVGAKVTLSNPAQAFEREGTSNEAGNYEFVALPPGTYTLTVEMQGFRKQEQKNLQLLVNTPVTLSVTLNIGAATETVEVLAQAEAINTTDASLGIAFNENQVKQLPMEGRNVPDLLTLQAGVAYTGNRSDINKDTDTRSGAVNGAHSDQSNITLDGVDVNDQMRGYAFTAVLPVSLDSVQEFRVTTTNYNADQGRSSGAQVSLVTKSGSNEFHGSLYEYHRNTVTSANDYFVKQAELSQGQPNKAPKLLRNIFGGSLGGPIHRDRLFFFATYEAARQREESSVVRIVPSDALRDGVITYLCTVPAACPGGSVSGLAGPHTIAAGYMGLTPSQLSGMDPLAIGPNSVVLSYFNSLPHSNDVSVGDGVNWVGYRFRGAVPTNNNWYIARADYKITSSGSHTVFWRGALRNDGHSEVPYLPGTPALRSIADFSKGFSAGYTGILRPTLVNNVRWGYTRQSIGNIGNNDSQPFIFFRGLNNDSSPNNSSLAVTRSQVFQVPVHNFVDDLSWTKGKHTFQFGTNVRFIRNPRTNFLNSFSQGVTNASALDTAGIAGTLSPLDPANNGFPAVDPAFGNAYDFPLVAMMGIVSELDAVYNYTKTGAALPQGTPVTRRFGADEFEFYAQDAYRIKPNLTVTYGLRYSLFSPPWETNGEQVAPTFSLGQWFDQRANNMVNGVPSSMDAPISFDLAGPANGKKGYYNWDYHNFAPRLSLAYSPRFGGDFLKRLFGEGDKTVVRAGFGVVYDRVGAGLLNTFDQYGSFGMSTQLTNDIIPSVSTAPRVTDLNVVPTMNYQNTQVLLPPAPPGGFPYTPPPGGTGLAIQWGLDDTIKTPYSYTLDLSIGRQLPKDFSIEVSYVGRLSHRLMIQEDLAMPLNIVDKTSGIDYFTAARRLSELAAAGTPTASITPALVGSSAAYWQNIMAPLQAGDAYTLACSSGGGSTTSPLQAVYDLYTCNTFNETTAQFQLDVAGSDWSGNPGIAGAIPGNYYPTKFGGNAFYNNQFHSLYAWRSMANANYHGLQVNVRKRMSHGLQFDLNYTFSKSIDLSSDAERVTAWGGLGGNIINSWSPKQLRAVSDFDTKHQINANWIVELPFGHNRLLGKNAHGALEAVIGGWQLSGLARWSSGFPVNITNGYTWPTNWQLGGQATLIGTATTGTTKNPDGSVNLFPNPLGPNGIGAFRNDYPGESGSRNVIRGDGFVGLDMGLSKRWKMPWKESQSLQFRWEVFNVPNFSRFDVQTVSSGLDAGGSFGNYTGMLTNPRVMQFALRYEF